MFNRIVVAIDGSSASFNAMEKAIELQQLTDAEIFLLCVYKHHSLFEASLSIGRPAEMDIPDKVLSEYAKEVVEHAKSQAIEHGATHVRGFVKAGRPSKVIVKFAREKKADLIVVGTRGTHSDKDGFLLGSVSHRVASNGKCPVLVV
ncbi:nucleotide-binding universal stress UspA family protein [Tamilnaduibacter salinus]|uniref:Nucleotide-binding universal stress UspA family protein n=1 Tax=Tamilnaduibacter salinus TaxID=1484056 RepID=A0A2A2I750_9GAMM|nr:universal stress protein [Tamilnaduibacter salinus]PAV27114.1 universal stress protein UspA [Tamilnaduibacter salinus]PVY76423.1 nucleotide-binding universal stress UspA family protein [Tamilnaduibacter salinus]